MKIFTVKSAYEAAATNLNLVISRQQNSADHSWKMLSKKLALYLKRTAKLDSKVAKLQAKIDGLATDRNALKFDLDIVYADDRIVWANVNDEQVLAQAALENLKVQYGITD